MRIKKFAAVPVAVALLTVAQSPATSAQKASIQTPNNQSKMVIVLPGDSLSSIADANQTTYVRIFDANNQVTDPNVINPGDNLRIPLPDEQLPDRPLLVSSTTAGISAGATSKPVTRAYAYAPATTTYTAGDGSTWDKLAQCEAGGNWGASTGNGFYGGLQFTESSWAAAGGSGNPSSASREEQIARAQTLQQRQGWGAWPACSAKLGLR